MNRCVLRGELLVLARFKALMWRKQTSDEMDEELAYHLAAEILLVTMSHRQIIPGPGHPPSPWRGCGASVASTP